MNQQCCVVFLIALVYYSSADTAPNTSNDLCNTASEVVDASDTTNLYRCKTEQIRKHKLRIMYMDAQYMTENMPAQKKAADLNVAYTCADPVNSLPEWCSKLSFLVHLVR